MFGNYWKTAIRHILRYKGYSFIKIFGLSLGIASCLFIYLFVADELSFDDFHAHKDELFRVVQIQFNKDSGRETGFSQFIPAPVGPELVQSAHEIRRQTRYVSVQGAVRHGDAVFSETLTLVDPSFLEMFTFPLVAGDPRSALADDARLVMTRSRAAKYFGTENPLGQTLTVTCGQSHRDFVVSAVVRDASRNSSLQFDILVPINNLPAESDDPGVLNDWNRWYCPLFVQLQPDAAPDDVAPALNRFCRQYYGTTIDRYIKEGHDPFRFGLQKLGDVHFDTRFAGTAGLSASYLLSAIAFAILLIACVNFVNLSIGSSSVRSREVGLRKILGAGRRQIIGQFGSEALVASFSALLLGLALTDLLTPAFNSLSGKQVSVATFLGGAHWLALPAIAVLAGLLAGLTPAVVMSSLRPVEIMRGKLKIGGRTTLTKGLVVLQFALSVVLGISSVILTRQVAFMIHKNPGYVSKGLVVILTQANEPAEAERIYHRFRNEVVSDSRIKGLTASNREFGLFLPGSAMERGGRRIGYRFDRVDPHFLATMEFNLTEGRDFSPDISTDRDAVIVNERFLKELGPDFHVGEYLGDISQGFPYNARIIGVIGDCHYSSMRTEIEPLILYVGEDSSPRRSTFSRIIVRVDERHLKEALPALENAWKRIRPDAPFVSYLQDEAIEGLYGRESRWSAIVRYASGLSLLLACLGILGLTSITLSRRVKEIGIRKVLGAGAGQIVVMATREFVLLISLANVIAWPIVYFMMRRVLENYAYRIGIAPGYFILAWAASVLIAVLTTLYLSAKAALQNPIKSLRYE
jgi:putative ABC transport system permease protein